MAEEVKGQTELEQKNLDAIRAMVVENNKKVADDAAAAVRAAVAEIRKDDDAQLKRFADAGVLGVSPDQKRGAGSGVRVVNRAIHQYARMYREDPETQAFRFPEADSAAAEWIRALAGYGGAGPVPAQALAAQKRLMEIFSEDTLRDYYCGERVLEGKDGRPVWEGARGVRANLLEGLSTAGSGLSAGSAAPLIPLPLELSLISAINKAAKVRMLCPIYNSIAKTLRVPSRGAATAAMVAEGATAAQGEPAFTGNLFDKKKMQALFGISREALADSAFNVVSILADAAGGAMGELEDLQICANGNGTAPNFSATLVAGVTDVAEATSTVLTYTDLVKLWYAVPEQYQVGAVWIVASDVAEFLSRLVITGGMGPVLVPKTGPFVTVGDMANVQGTIFGKPVMVNQIAAGSIFVGNLALSYGLLETPGIVFDESMHAGWSTDTIQYKFTRRIDGQSLLVAAARKMLALASIA